MRVEIVTESFLPLVNGVTVSVQRLSEQLQHRGHQVLVVAPEGGVTSWAGAEVVGVPAAPVPGYSGHRFPFPWPWLTGTLRAFRPDLIHLASPAVLGAQGAVAAGRLGVPCIAVYQTDLAAYAALYRAPGASRAVWRWLRWIHTQAGATLAPSRQAVAELQARGVPRVSLWRRGVDLERFAPRHRDQTLRAGLAGDDGRLLVGYVGRLAVEKQVHLLAGLAADPRFRVVVVGEGPVRGDLQRRLPGAHFLGLQGGERLASIVASLDVFVHTGPHETFCQAAQEALASGVPVVAPAAGGLLDLVDDGANGLLYPAGSGADLTDAVRRLADDPGTLAVMARNARASVLGRSWEAVTDQYLVTAHGLLARGAVNRTAA